MKSSEEKSGPERVAMLTSHDDSVVGNGQSGRLQKARNRRSSNEDTATQQEEIDLFNEPKDLESPGNLSQGHMSLGLQSLVSEQSDHSWAGFLKKGDTEKEVIIDQVLTLYNEEKDNQCKIGRFSPACFQMCMNIEMFVVFMCVLIVVASSLTTGYLNSVITTIEKRFEIGSSVSGLVAAAYEFGNLVAVIFVSFLGASRHIPKMIGIGVLVMGTGSLLFSLPHIIAPKYSISSGMMENTTADGSICRGSGHHSDADLCIEQNSGNWGYVLLLVAAQVLIGTGSSPIMTLGIIYVDNHVLKEKSPGYLACMHASGALGPVLGYALGALLLRYYVDTFTYDVKMTPSSSRWIGAWWGGFIICGLLLIFLALPFLSYPRVLVKEKRRILEMKTKEALLAPVEDVVTEDKQYGRTIKEIPKAILHLLKNPVYAVLLPAICTEICIVAGFVVFLPKYLESQFGTSTSDANLLTGGIAIPGAVIGILTGGFILRRLALTPKGAVQFVLLLNTLALCGFSFFFYMGCDNPKIAGANFPYFNSSGHRIFEANLTSACNQNCACSQNSLNYICGINAITYFSPCHAGCTGSNDFYVAGKEEKSVNYSGCSCISGPPAAHSDLEVYYSPVATSGACKNTCEMLRPFLILLVVMVFCVAGTQMPLLMITLRSVGTMERSFALGLQFVGMRLFAYIPSPIFFGNAIDSACVLWKVTCERNGSCLLYDIVTFRYKYIGIAAGLKVLSMCFFITLWYFIRRRTLAELAAENKAKSRRSSLTSMEKTEGTKFETGTNMTHPTQLQVPSPSLQTHHDLDLQQTQGSTLKPKEGDMKMKGQDQPLNDLACNGPIEDCVHFTNGTRVLNIPRQESVL